ncbi:AAA family ATPase [Agromyces sp. MMS24-JH15]|uniref:helix-turn-helix transcriptional regulator n=1 Tax=Agromyces sp. MMS24-JH15 TaxID=3243765 RepID=UPI00374A1CF5
MGDDTAKTLHGRQRECDALDGVVRHVRAGHGRVLVIRGEAGVGKSALLRFLSDAAIGCRVIGAAGVEYEMELAYAGIHQLCAPLMHLRERLPDRQRDALETAFGLSAKAAPDRFIVGLGVLGLLAEASDVQPLLCIIDDAQWMDRASAEILAFVARRLLAESVGLVFAVRDVGTAQELDGLPELRLRGLESVHARALLESVWPGRLDQQVLDRVLAEAHGNPLALLEFSRSLPPTSLAGGFGFPESTPLASRIEQNFRRQFEALPVDARRLLLVAAAEPVGDVALLWRAAGRLGIDAAAAEAAESSGLIQLGGQARFRHPLVRSAVYGAASSSERRQVHRALAEATEVETDHDRRVWHLAHAAPGLDEALARELEASAERARRRGGVAAAAAFLQRSAELTPESAERARRTLAAARAKFDSGALEVALELLADAETRVLDELQRASLAYLRAEVIFTLRRGSDAPPLLLEAAERLEPLDTALALEAYLEALGAAIFVGRLGGDVGPSEVSAAARAVLRVHPASRPTDLLLDGLATRYTEGYEAGMVLLVRALDAIGRGALSEEGDFGRWFWMRWLVAADVWDDDRWHDLASRAVHFGRETGSLVGLPLALGYRAIVHVYAGQFTEAAALVEEARAIEAATGSAPVGFASLLLAAWRGNEHDAAPLFDWGLKNTQARGEGRGIGGFGYATGVLNNGLGRYEAAFAGTRSATEYDDLGITGFALLELVEAGVRSGARDQAVSAFEKLERGTRASGTDWALGVQAWTRAMLSEDADAEERYREAIRRLERTRIHMHLARAQLSFGEWLRRARRRAEAREHLRAAHERFTDAGALAFADRALRELIATGETVLARTPESRDILTPQEFQVARLARDGLSNPEIGAQLFISPRTAQYHLRKVFQKLGITSRNQLAQLPAGTLGST